MSDHTAAHVFSLMFETLAADEFMFTTPDHSINAARKIWAQISQFDFSPHQMGCDEALIKLGLARFANDPYCPGAKVIKYEGRR